MRKMTTQHDDAPETDQAAMTEAGPEAATARAPLLLTLRLAEPAQGLFQALRDRHFPADRNVVPAHVSLFHQLPGAERPSITRRLRALEAERPSVQVEAPIPFGRGVGFRLLSPALQAIRADLARDWADWLTPQDRQGYRPHITVQNKVTPEHARETLDLLSRGFVPFRTEGATLVLWRYLGGPWEQLEEVALLPPSPTATPGSIRRG